MKTRTVLFVLALLLCIACNTRPSKGADIAAITEIQAKEKAIMDKVTVFLDDFHNKRDSSQLDRLLTEDYVRYMNGIKVASGPSELYANMNVFLTGFPDFHITDAHRYIRENQVFVHWAFTGTNTGVFAEVSATGKKASITGLSRLYFNEDGKMYREDVYYNELDLLQQLGYTLKPPVVE
ncbi:MAG: ester cyclase [Saonia sp.]